MCCLLRYLAIFNIWELDRRQINKFRFYTSRATKPEEQNNFKFNPWWITGFIDGEGSFSIKISKREERKTNWQVQLSFALGLHIKDLAILKSLQNYFKVGGIGKHGLKTVQFYVNSREDLAIILQHLNKFPLITKKRADFELFKEVLNLYNNKQHLTLEGLGKIVSIKKVANKGLSPELEKAFPEVTALAAQVRPLVQSPQISNPYWLAGFVSAEGSFMVSFKKSNSKAGIPLTLLCFQVTQHMRKLEMRN